MTLDRLVAEQKITVGISTSRGGWKAWAYVGDFTFPDPEGATEPAGMRYVTGATLPEVIDLLIAECLENPPTRERA